jgi:hypothetical protein
LVGQNCALYGCPTSRTHEGRSLFKIPVVGAADGEETTALKKTAREEWLRLLLRTRQVTADLKNRIETNNLTSSFATFIFSPNVSFRVGNYNIIRLRFSLNIMYHSAISVPTENLPTKS